MSRKDSEGTDPKSYTLPELINLGKLDAELAANLVASLNHGSSMIFVGDESKDIMRAVVQMYDSGKRINAHGDIYFNYKDIFRADQYVLDMPIQPIWSETPKISRPRVWKDVVEPIKGLNEKQHSSLIYIDEIVDEDQELALAAIASKDYPIITAKKGKLPEVFMKHVHPAGLRLYPFDITNAQIVEFKPSGVDRVPYNEVEIYKNVLEESSRRKIFDVEKVFNIYRHLENLIHSLENHPS